MKSVIHYLPAAGVFSVLQLAIMQAYAAPITLSNSPLFLSAAKKANVLMMYGNSNSMDTDPTGRAVGSAADDSKSQIARVAMKSVMSNYAGLINMGLLAYDQKSVEKYFIEDAQYDASFNPADYDPNYNGPRNGTKKKFKIPNPSSPGEFIYYNVNLPSYSGSQMTGARFCYSATACTDPSHDFFGVSQNGKKCGEREDTTQPIASHGPWDTFACYTKKTGSSNGAPNSAGSGYTNLVSNSTYHATDSDIGQGITDFGHNLTMQGVGATWFSNVSPGKGYLHVPVAALTSAQSDLLSKKLARSQFTTNAPTDANQPLQNAGLSPLAGTVLTANEYYNGKLLMPGSTTTTYPKPPESCSKNYLVTLTDGLPSVDKDGTPNPVVSSSLAGLLTEVKALKASAAQAETYVVGFALPYGVSINQLHSIAQAGGSDHAYDASNTETLNKAFADIFADIISKSSAASSVALNSASVAVNANIYQARFSATDWSGQLLSFKLLDTGKLSTTPTWDAGAKLKDVDPDKRVIMTSNAAGVKKGIPFRWPVDSTKPLVSELSATQIAALQKTGDGTVDNNGAKRVNYLRGSSVDEGTLRKRPTTKLGDIVNSAPYYVGIPEDNYGEVSYREFRTAKKNRTKMIYVGANDGMLHGFDVATGLEKFAYVPTAAYANLSKLTDVFYVHRYFVDGTLSAADVSTGTGKEQKWSTVLTAGLGNGGTGFVALDVTDPTQFDEKNAAQVVKFEYTQADDADVGFIPGAIAVVKLNNGAYGAVFANGYNSAGTGKATLFVVDIETGKQIAKLQTPAGDLTTPNALATPLLIDTNGDRTVDVVYAGDQQGNVWKFDLSDSSPAQWKVDYKLFKADHPITSAVEVGEHPKDGFMVYVGTGKYLEGTDIADKTKRAVYGIQDKTWGSGDIAAHKELQKLTAARVALSELAVQSFVTVTKEGSPPLRAATNVSVTGKLGWTVTFPNDGERVVSQPILRDRRLIFTSIIPSNAECTPGGNSWFNELDWLTGGQLPKAQIDTDNNGEFNDKDTNVSGVMITGIVSSPAIQDSPIKSSDGTPQELNLLNTSNGEITAPLGMGDPKHARRLSWRQIK
ncbi:MAG TPA: PilC/PilY family type IV pilus protein [Telluria sp.]|nr:PilC/PilY family type IV pilus protein [Telluria sp.]